MKVVMEEMRSIGCRTNEHSAIIVSHLALARGQITN